MPVPVLAGVAGGAGRRQHVARAAGGYQLLPGPIRPPAEAHKQVRPPHTPATIGRSSSGNQRRQNHRRGGDQRRQLQRGWVDAAHRTDAAYLPGGGRLDTSHARDAEAPGLRQGDLPPRGAALPRR